MPARTLPHRRRPPRPTLGRPRAVHPLLLGLAGLALLAPVFGSCGAAASTPAPPPPAGLDIPADYLALYQRAGSTCAGLDWAVLAGIGRVETNHGRSTLPGVHNGQNFAGAMGPMQFLSGTFTAVRQRHPEIGGDVYDPNDAIPAAADYLCDNGFSSNPHGAIWQYNHADWYVAEVLDQAHAYRSAA